MSSPPPAERPAPTAAELLAALRTLGYVVRRRGEHVRLEFPAESRPGDREASVAALTPHKAAIVALLEAEEAQVLREAEALLAPPPRDRPPG
jgi:hypothetical protein